MTFPDREVLSELGLTQEVVSLILESQPADAERMLDQAKALANFRFRVLVRRAHPDSGGDGTSARIEALLKARNYIRALRVVATTTGEVLSP